MSDTVGTKDQFTLITPENYHDIFINYKTNEVRHITLHWTVGLPDQLWTPYHACITGDGGIYLNKESYTWMGYFQKLSHTWMENTANFGIALCGMYGASMPPENYVPKDLYTFPECYGKYAPTKAQMDSMAWFSAKLLRHYNLPITALMTHADWAKEDKYYPDRWEFVFEKPLIVAEVERIKESFG
jgi:hypothetical protein